ncbi:hypothetical protein GCM10027578_05070 [Spirosoma luteolum]
MNPSPTYPELDTLGPDRPGPALANKPYSSNPYWSRGAKPSTEPTTAKPEPMAFHPAAPSGDFPAHLIGTLLEALDKAGQTQQEKLVGTLTEWLPHLPATLTPAIEAQLTRLVPSVVKVEQPGQAVLQLVRYLTGGLVVVGMLLGGLVFAWLQTRQQRDTYAAGYWQHRYLLAQVAVARTPPMQRLLQRADTLYRSPQFKDELQRLESILDTRQQQYLLHLREQQLTQPSQ